MTDADDKRAGGERWWLNPSIARMAFGSQDRAPPGRPPGATTMALQEALHSGQPLDLRDPGQRELGEYELLELIGQGGMGLVYRARQRTLGRDVAIKLLSALQWASEDLIEILRQEAHQAAVLHHPNIVTVHEFGEHGGLNFYVMELVTGHSLSQRLATGGPMSPTQIAKVLCAVAEAVDYAHRMGVLHLDLKPGNILIDEHGDPRIADFGLARKIEHALECREVNGTPNYMAPEQARTDGPPITPATDVWALGAVMYEMLTGRPPFEADGDDPAATLRLVCDGTLCRPSELASVPADLEAICLKSLNRDPGQRYANARLMADDLARFSAGRPVSVRPLPLAARILRWAYREPQLASVATALFAALLTGVLATSTQWQRAEHKVAALSAQLAARGGPVDAPQGTGTSSPGEQGRSAARSGTDRAGPGHTRTTAGTGGISGPTAAPPAPLQPRPLAIALSQDASLLAVALDDRSVRFYDASTLLERGRLAPPDGGGDAGNPAAAPPLSILQGDGGSATYSPDGRHALLRDRRGQLQLWQVAPRTRLSPSAPREARIER